ncbi:hypothetical protein, partial [Thiolapillus sp.]|uniref:hypothetical protein n=1 Tax=Thiolapillus sp. TaxID=2017437 RepID=UPI003AF60474
CSFIVFFPSCVVDTRKYVRIVMPGQHSYSHKDIDTNTHQFYCLSMFDLLHSEEKRNGWQNVSQLREDDLPQNPQRKEVLAL